jgi:hypothetical protein
VSVNQTNNTVILQGLLPNYTAFNSAGTGLPHNPYTRSTFIFTGDNTGHGASTSDIARLAVATASLGTANSDSLTGTTQNDLGAGG